jgi:hypothetical protein
MKQQREQVFISYSHKDKEWLEKLTTMLKPLVRNQTINVWDDTKIKAGSQWKDEINKALAAAKIAVLIVSPNFLASDFIAEHELPPLLQVAEQDGLTIIWVYISSCLYKETEIGNYQAAHNISRPLKGLSEAELDDVLVDICQKIKALIGERKPLIPNGENPSAQNEDHHLDRPDVELLCYREILCPGAVIRIKGYWHIGKTSMVHRILDHAQKQGYLTIYLGFRDSISDDDDSFNQLDSLLKWFCYTITDSLTSQPNLSSDLDRFRKDYLTAQQNCTNYFQRYLLPQLSSPLVLGLDDVTLLYKKPKIAESFFALLRSWHQKAKYDNNWGKLRLVLAYSQEFETIDIQGITLSPFNIGLPINPEKLEFSSEHVLQLAKLHHLNWNNSQIEKLMDLVGGHPFLIKEALSKISRKDISLEQFLAQPEQVSAIGDHLESLRLKLQNQLAFKQVMFNIVSETDLANLDVTLVETLKSMGLVKQSGRYPMPSCKLYREYFKSL